jgi:methylmalonyl-CoA mutase N-terminal domain/subunit
MESQLGKLERLKAERDNAAVESAIGRLRECASGSDNLMPAMMEAVASYATLGEICDTLREIFGEYTAVSTL